MEGKEGEERVEGARGGGEGEKEVDKQNGMYVEGVEDLLKGREKREGEQMENPSKAGSDKKSENEEGEEGSDKESENEEGEEEEGGKEQPSKLDFSGFGSRIGDEEGKEETCGKCYGEGAGQWISCDECGDWICQKCVDIEGASEIKRVAEITTRVEGLVWMCSDCREEWKNRGELKGELKEMFEGADKLVGYNSQLKEDVKEKDKEIGDLKSNMEHCKNLVQEKMSKMKDIMDERDNMRTEMEKGENKIKEITEKMSENLVRESIAKTEYERDLQEMDIRIKDRNGEIKKLQNELKKAKEGVEELERMRREDKDRFDKGKAEVMKDNESLRKKWEDLIKINESLERELKGEKETSRGLRPMYLRHIVRPQT